MQHHGLHYYHSRVHYHAEVYRAKAHQVAVYAKEFHHAEGEEHAQRNDTRHHKSGASVAKEEYEHENHYQSALYEVSGNGAFHTVHEIGAVDKRLYHHAFGQALLYLRHAMLHVLYHLLEVLAFQHDGYTRHHFALSVARHRTEACGVAISHVCHVAHPDRCARYVFHGDVSNVVERLCHANATNVVLVGVLLDVASSRVGIVLLYSVEHFGNAYAVGVKAVGAQRHLVLLHITSPAAHLCHARRAGELFPYDPVLYSSQVGEAVFVLISLFRPHGVMVYLAKARGYGSHLRVGVLWQVLHCLAEHLAHLGSCPINVGIVVEDKRYDRQSATRDAASLLKAWDVRQRHLYGRGDILFHLLRAKRRGLGYHLHLVVGDVGRGVEGKVHKRPHAPCHKGQGQHADNELVAYRIVNKFLKHSLAFNDCARRDRQSWRRDTTRSR